MNRREHSHPFDFSNDCNFLSKRDPPKSRIGTDCPFGLSSSASTLPPTFLFLQYSVVKDQTQRTQCLGPVHLRLRARSSVAHAALLIWFNKGELQSRQRRAALVGEAYIVGAPPKCQHRFRSFLNFLRRPFGPRRFRPFNPAKEADKRHPRAPIGARSARVEPYVGYMFLYSRRAGEAVLTCPRG
jgi:hypothetical protein